MRFPNAGERTHLPVLCSVLVRPIKTIAPRQHFHNVLCLSAAKGMIITMTDTVQQALSLMAIALPAMFAVILLFMGATALLHKTFPAKEEKAAQD